MKNKLSKKVEKEILSKEWTFGYDRRMGFRLINLFYDGYTRAFNTYFGTQFSDNVFRIKDGIVAQYFPTNSDKKNLKKIEGLFLDNKFASKILKQIVSSYRIFNRYVEKMPISYTGKSNQFHYRQLSKFLKQERGISRTSRILFSPFEELLVKRLDSLLKEKEMSNASDIKETLSLQTELLPSDEYKKDLCSVVLKRMTIKTLTKKYKHFGMLDWYYEEETEADHLKKIQELTEEGAQSYLNELKDKYKNRKLDVSKIKKIFKNDKVLSSLIDLYVVYANYKELKNYWRGMASYKLKFIMSEIAQRLNLSNEQVAFLTYEEIENALLFKKEIKKEELDNRMKNSVFIYKQDKLYIVNDGNFLERLDIVLNSKEQTELQGTSAFRGLVRGVVKIVISSNDFKKVNQGDILVTSTTRPDYIKVMEKAGAFVTNEGGMLSHAAILAREMKKPCVIGTKVATKVLKDGDLVEVDAEKGEVRILKRV